MKLNRVLLSILFVQLSLPSFAQRIQFANNCPDNAFTGIDIYVDGLIFRDDINFREATSFLDIVPGNHVISVAPNTSISVSDAFYTSASLAFQAQDTVIAIANGTNTSIGFNPYKTFSLDVFYGARELSHDPANVDLIFTNGVTDAGKVDFRSGLDTWLNDFDLGDISGYSELAAGSTKIFRVTTNTGSGTFDTYDLTLPLIWGGKSGIVLTTGFANPQSNNNGPGFSAMIIFSDGGQFQPLTTTVPESYARVQLIHNSADALADTVDVYVNNDLVLDNMPFLTATGFMDAPANTALDIGIAPKNSLASTDAFYSLHTTFDSAGTYILVTHGIESSTGYNPAPPFSIEIFNQAKEVPSSGSTDILFMHGSTDKPGFNIDQGTNNWVSNIYDGAFSSSYTTKATNDYIITLKDIATPTDTLRYNANLQSMGFGGKAITILGCGFKNPGNNSNGLPFKLYVATADGGALVPFTIVPPEPINVNVIGANATIKIFPNPANDKLAITGLNSNCTVTFYTVMGTIAKTVETQNNNTIDVSDLSDGIYLIRVNADGSTLQQLTLVKE